MGQHRQLHETSAADGQFRSPHVEDSGGQIGVVLVDLLDDWMIVPPVVPFGVGEGPFELDCDRGPNGHVDGLGSGNIRVDKWHSPITI